MGEVGAGGSSPGILKHGLANGGDRTGMVERQG